MFPKYDALRKLQKRLNRTPSKKHNLNPIMRKSQINPNWEFILQINKFELFKNVSNESKVGETGPGQKKIRRCEN